MRSVLKLYRTTNAQLVRQKSNAKSVDHFADPQDASNFPIAGL
jgi:hypothetical protein